jgi:hypothetical protein
MGYGTVQDYLQACLDTVLSCEYHTIPTKKNNKRERRKIVFFAIPMIYLISSCHDAIFLHNKVSLVVTSFISRAGLKAFGTITMDIKIFLGF